MQKLNLSWLRKARRNLGITVEKVAHELGKDNVTIWRYESGVTPLTVDTLFKMLNFYGASITDVVQEVRSDDID